MSGVAAVAGAIVVLAAGTYAFRLSGVLLRTRATLPPEADRLTGIAVATLFCALVATSSLLENATFAGFARPAGVAVAGVLAWARAPFIVVVLAAAVVAAGLRVLGIP